jgi:predicted transcriptional regulator
MTSLVIGEGKDFETAQEWIDARVQEWLDEAALERAK